MIPVHYSESVSLANVKDYGSDRCVSLCDRARARPRVKEEVHFGEVLDSVGFADSVYCYLDSTKRRFRSTVFYAPRVRPKAFSETYYLPPRHTSLSYESSHEHHPNKVTRRWYSASLSYAAREFNSGIAVVGPEEDEVFGESGDAVSGKTISVGRKEPLGKGRHRSTVDVKVKQSTPGRPPFDSNNNVMTDADCVLRYQTGNDEPPSSSYCSPNDEVVFRSAVKVVGNPNH